MRDLVVIGALCAAVAGCAREAADDPLSWRDELGTATEAEVPEGRVTIHEPPELTSLATGRLDAEGRPIRVACETCHGIDGLAATFRESTGELGPPHIGIVFEHGGSRCEACHDREERLSLHLADGRRVPMTDAMELCRQCHGPQSRDYDHGSHGGMRGAWDLERGGRVRANCLDCHDAHRPAWDPVVPMPRTIDRFEPAHPEEEE